jgi:2,3-bisphosphoglycerate-dependent phosphoglycerate mutase
MHLYFVRHAQSENNALYALTGSSAGRHADPGLTELGHRQALLVAGLLAAGEEGGGARDADRHNRSGFGLTHLYCSLMVRAVETGSYIAEATGLPLLGWPEIHERGGLHLTDDATGEEVGQAGPNRDFFRANYPALVLPDTIGEQGWWNHRPPETVAESIPRASAVWHELLRRHGGTEDRVALVSHGGFFQSLLSVIVNMSRRKLGEDLEGDGIAHDALWFGISNTAVSRFEVYEDAVVIRYLNRVDHLPNDLITG